MIEKEIFAQFMGLIAGRIGRELDGPVFAEYYRHLSSELTTEQFIGAATLVFRSWSAEYRNWPSPEQFIALIRPAASPTLSAGEAFERVLEIANRHPQLPGFAMRQGDMQALGAATLRGFLAAGGFRELTNAPLDQVPWLRKRFVDAYADACLHADAERDAAVALESADMRFQQLVSATAAQLTMPEPKRIAGGGR